MSVAGSCFARPFWGRDSYGLTYYADMWGWATWRRAWIHYDSEMSTWTAEAAARLKLRLEQPEFDYWATIFDAMKRKEIDTWDYQWIWTVIAHEGLVVTPHRNMIQNLGFGADSTHTSDPNWYLKNRKLESVDFPLTHPKQLKRNPRWSVLWINAFRPCAQHSQAADDRCSNGLSAV